MFADILGQQNITRVLHSELEEGKVHHAYLFYGPKGSGKKTLGKLLSLALNCENFPDGPCHKCHSCLLAAGGNHTDIHFIAPDGKSLKIGQVRQLKQTAALKPYAGRYQVFILDATLTVTPEASNSLLSVLEEPGPDTVFIILCENPHVLPQTIVSRCQLFALARLTTENLGELLDQQGQLTPEQKEMAICFAEGIPGNALAAACIDWPEILNAAITFLYNWSADTCYSSLAMELSSRENIHEFIHVLLSLLRDLIVLQLTGNTGQLLLHSQAERLAVLSDVWPVKKAFNALEAILGLQKNLKSPVNVRLSVERALRCLKEEV